MLKITTLLMATVLTAVAAQRVSELPAGVINGTNTAFTLGYLPYPDTVRVYKNGVRLSVSTDFLLNGQTLTFLVVPTTGDLVMVDYEVLVPNGFHMLLNKATGYCVMPSSTNKILSASCSGADAQKLSITSTSGGFLLTVKSSSQQIDLLNGGTTDGTQIIQSPTSGSRSQVWQPLAVDNDNFFQLTNSLTNSCLTLSGGSIVLQTCSGLDTQKWQWQ